jgi:hypothetical protein
VDGVLAPEEAAGGVSAIVDILCYTSFGNGIF